MPINRSQTPATARFTVSLNIVPKSWRTFARVSGRKNMTDSEQDRVMTVE
jgi:hypothetical protein